jgi:ribose-phosphate pyrophosphokinase
VIAPDLGRAKPAARFAARLGLTVAAADKRRLSDHEVWIGGSVARQVEGYRRALVYDDEIATGSTVFEMGKVLIDSGIEEIFLVCTHGLFTGDALPQLTSLGQIREIVTTNTVPIPPEKMSSMLTILSVAPVFGEAILRNYSRQSIGDLFSFSDEQR